jgi:hypothetical protein
VAFGNERKKNGKIQHVVHLEVISASGDYLLPKANIQGCGILHFVISSMLL